MSRNRAVRAVTSGVRIVVGAAIAAACVAGVVVGAGTAWPTIADEPASADIEPTRGDTTLVCNGDFRALARNSQDVSEISAAGQPALTAFGLGDFTTTPLETPDLQDATGAAAAITQPASEDAPLLTAAESYGLAADDLSGFAAAACRAPVNEAWLIGGNVETGANDLVIISNPGAVPATVTLTVYGATPGRSTVVVPPQTQSAIPLTSIAVGNPQPVVRVNSEGSAVRATLQSSIVRVLDPAGIDLQDDAGAPREELTFTGVRVVSSVEGLTSTEVRLLSPDADTTASVTATAVGESTPAVEVTLPMTAGEPAVASLEGIALGDYTITVTADQPLTGAVSQASGTAGGTDFAWMTPAPLLTDDVLVAVPQGPSPQIMLTNPGSTDAVVTFSENGTGEPSEGTVPAGGSLTVTASSATTYLMSSTEPIHAAVSMTDGNLLAGWPVLPDHATEGSVTVYQ